MNWFKLLRAKRIAANKHALIEYLVLQGFTDDVYGRFYKKLNDSLRILITFKGSVFEIEVSNTTNEETDSWTMNVPYGDLSLSGLSAESLIRNSVMDAVNSHLFDNI